jgi:hypothetical protein
MRFLGYFLIALPFIAIAILEYEIVGFGMIVFSFGGTAIIIVLIIAGIALVDAD